MFFGFFAPGGGNLKILLTNVLTLLSEQQKITREHFAAFINFWSDKYERTIGQNLDEDTFEFGTSIQSLISKSCHIDNLAPLMILIWNLNQELNLTKKIVVICDVIVTFAMYCWFGAIPKLDPNARSKIQRTPDSESKEFRRHGLRSLNSH